MKFRIKFILNPLRNIKIQSRLILLFLILSLIPLLITSLFSFKQSSDAVKTKISTYSVQVMDQVSANIKRELDMLEYDSVEIEFSDTVQNFLKNYNDMSEWQIEDTHNAMQNILVKKFSFLHDVSDVLIYTQNRNRLNAYGDEGIKFNLKSEYLSKYLDMLNRKNGTPVWTIANPENEDHLVNYATSAELLSKSNGILLGRAIKSLAQGDIIGSLIIRTNERLFSNIYRDIDIGKDADIFVIDSQGIVVSSRNPKIALAKPYKENSLFGRIEYNNVKDERVFNLDIGGSPHLVSYAHIVNADWFVVSTIPYSYLNSESKKTSTNIILLALFCFFIAVILSYLFSISISYPLKKLTRAMNEAKKGNLSINIRDDSKDEISEVANNFNNMLNEIKKLMEDVKNKERQKRDAELKTLQAQINPHFLSNTLNTVKWLANIQKAENIENITTSLIQLLHVSVGSGDDLISIREEIEYIKNYINIQEYRYYNKFKVKFEIEEEIMDCKIIKLLLQPVVENSLIHGIEPMDGQGVIVIKGFRYEDVIKITVTDNGVGMTEDVLKNLLIIEPMASKSRFSGIGISNVNERIKMYFGEKYGLNIQSVPKLYTTVEITIPII
jgi:two-component system sensor histidine kinase YesM